MRSADRWRFEKPSKHNRSDEGTFVANTILHASSPRQKTRRTPSPSGAASVLLDLVRARAAAIACGGADLAAQPFRPTDPVQRVQVAGPQQSGSRGDGWRSNDHRQAA